MKLVKRLLQANKKWHRDGKKLALSPKVLQFLNRWAK